MTEISDARRIQESIRSEFRNSAELVTDADFYTELQYWYEDSKRDLKINEEASESRIKATRNGLFVISVGLFCFGRLDVAEDILDNIPGGRGSVNHFAGVLHRLLPLPPGFNCLKNPNEIKEWLKLNRSQLRWDKSLERYILENFKILPDIPANYNLEEFKVTDKEISQTGLIVEIISNTGSKWLGNFQSGCSKFSGVYQYPNKNDLIVVSQGQGYIVNPESKQLLSSFAGNIIDVIDIPHLLKDTYCILFINEYKLLCHDSSGFRWQNTEISWNKVRELQVNDFRLTGEFYYFQERVWKQFWLNIIKNEFHLGEFKWEDLLPKPKPPWWQFW